MSLPGRSKTTRHTSGYISGEPVYVHDLPFTCVARLILGWNMPQAGVDLACGVVERINPTVDILHVRFVKGQIELVQCISTALPA
jgi:hypothetical protein